MLDGTRKVRDGFGVARSRLRLALLLAVFVPLLLACGSAETATDRAATLLAQGADQAHQRALEERTADPASRDQAAADRLGYAITGGNPTMVVAANGTPLGIDVVTTVGARAQAGGGLSYEQVTLGACLRTTATPGSAAIGARGRGTVETEAVACPDGTMPIADGAPVEATTTDLRTRRSDVPRRGPRGCLRGSHDCPVG